MSAARAWSSRSRTKSDRPGSGSWLNAVETFFSALTRRRIRRGSFHSIVDLQAASNRFIAEHNADPKPFTWTKPADEILTEGYLEVARAIEPYRLMWLEIDSYDPGGRASIRHASRTPIASCESLFGRRQFRPFLDARAVDVAIVDVPWNGILEGLKIAAMAECYEVNCAPHNFYGHLSTMMSAHFCATIGNLRIMEIDIDDVPWKDEVVSRPAIEAGHLVLSDAPGWGVEVNEAAIRAHPPKR